MSKILFLNPPASYGGPGTFQTNIENFLKSKDIEILYQGTTATPDLIFIISATRKLGLLIKYKLLGVKIIQRLDGINWRHKIENTSLLFRLKCEIVNLIMAFIRKFLSDYVIYQSKYIENLWNEKYGKIDNCSIIYNGSQKKSSLSPKSKLYTITCVEGSIQEDELTENLIKNIGLLAKSNKNIDKVELYGFCSNKFINRFKNDKINFMGLIERDQIIDLYRNKRRIFFLLELNPPCPNSLIEALINNTPALGYDTGSFKEIVRNCGVVLPYNGNAYNLDFPNFNLLSEGAKKITDNYMIYAENCEKNINRFSLDNMNSQYFKIIKKYL